MVGRVKNLFVKPGPGEAMKASAELSLVAGKGIHGDNAFGRKRRQVLLVDQAILEAFGLEPGDLRENLTVSGLDLQSIAPGSLLAAGTSILMVQGECTPCSKMDDLKPGLQNALQTRRGVLASVVEGGSLRVGDAIEVRGE